MLGALAMLGVAHSCLIHTGCALQLLVHITDSSRVMTYEHWLSHVVSWEEVAELMRSLSVVVEVEWRLREGLPADGAFLEAKLLAKYL
jgi:hypothetical protein